MKRYCRLFPLGFYHIAGIILLLINFPFSFLVRRNKKKTNRDVVVLSSVAISYDGRIQKSLYKLEEHFEGVHLIKPKDTEEDSNVISIFFNKIFSIGYSGSYSYFPYSFDLLVFLRLFFAKEDYIYCHDIPTCLMGFISSRLSGKSFIADLHEWMSETVSISSTGKVTHLPFIKKWMFEIIERLVLKNADYVISVSHDLANLMKEKYDVEREILVIRNTGSILQDKFDSQEFSEQSYDKNNVRLMYIGQINAHRNIENLLHALKGCPRFSLLIQGTCSDNYKQHLMHLIKNFSIEDRVTFLPPVPPAQVIRAIRQADIGVMSCKKFSKNLNNSLPNKVFEYIWAEIPFICDNLPSVIEMMQGSRFVKFFDSDDVASIVHVLEDIDDNFLKTKQDVKRFKENIFSKDDFEQYAKIVCLS